MLPNATIIRITPPTPPTLGGEVTYAPDTRRLDIRCQMTAPTRRHIYQLGSVIADCQAVLRFELQELEERALEPDYQVEVLPDWGKKQTYLVKHVTPAIKSGLSNVTVFLRKP
ncbi:MAG: hypothetical protein ACM359_07090 [Bacillota bacterium]